MAKPILIIRIKGKKNCEEWISNHSKEVIEESCPDYNTIVLFETNGSDIQFEVLGVSQEYETKDLKTLESQLKKTILLKEKLTTKRQRKKWKIF